MNDLEQKKIEAYELMRRISNLTNEARRLQVELQKVEQEISKLEERGVKE